MKVTIKQEQKQLLWTAKQVAYHCGLSVRSVWRAKSIGLLPKSIKLGGSVRWRANDIQIWVQMDCPNLKEFHARIESERQQGKGA